MIKEPCNQIKREHFRLSLVNRKFPISRICSFFTKSYSIISTLTLHQFQLNLMPQFYKIVTFNLTWVPNTMLSFRKKIMHQSQEIFQTNRKADGRMEEWTDPIS